MFLTKQSRAGWTFVVLAAEQLARAEVLISIMEVIRQGRLTALRSDESGVRGIVVGDANAPSVVTWSSPQHRRRARSFDSCSANASCPPSTHRGRSGSDNVSIDGMSAFDLVSRAAMLRGLHSVVVGSPFHSKECSTANFRCTYGRTRRGAHDIHQAEDGEQNDALMPPFFGQHSVVEVLQTRSEAMNVSLRTSMTYCHNSIQGGSIAQRDLRGAVQTCWDPLHPREDQSVERSE